MDTEFVWDLAEWCKQAILLGNRFVRFEYGDKLPEGFPECEILTVALHNGQTLYAGNPIKVMEWIYARARG